MNINFDATTEDLETALKLVTAAENYYKAVNREPFDQNQYKLAEIELHRIAIVCGELMKKAREQDVFED